MIYSLWELLLPLLLVFSLGYLVSFLIHRWRRGKVARSDWTALESRSKEAEMELVTVRAVRDKASRESAALNDKVASLMTDYESAQAELDAANRSAEVLANEFDSAGAEAATLRSDLDSSHARVAELEAKLAVATEDAATVRTELNAVIARSAEELSESESRAGALQGALETSRSELEACQARRSDSDAHLATATADLDSARGRIGELEGELGGAHGRIGELEGGLSGTHSRVVELEAELSGARAQVSGFAGLADEADAVRGELGSAHGRIGELEGELGGAHGRIGELETQLAAQQSLAGELQAAQQQVETLTAQLEDAGRTRSELDSANGRIGELERQLSGAQVQVSGFESLEIEAGQLRAELDGARLQVNELESRLTEAAAKDVELDRLRVGLAERDSRVKQLEAAEADFQGIVRERNAARTELEQAQGKLADDLSALQATVEQRDQTIAELRSSLDQQKKIDKALPEPIRRAASWYTGSWKSGQTKLGTPGAGHSDDLKVINGIGPKMEGVLNSFGIKAWEQLAALDEDGVAKVDAALEDFPGRIERDEWVGQARAIIENNYEPQKRAPKARPKPSWQKGTTKLGTPGAGHSDDLKVINGIGPKMEGLLNSFGIKAWEQLAALKKAEVVSVNEALDFFPGRIERDEWVAQAKELVKEFPDTKKRPTRATYLNRSKDDDPFN